jgi:hypothetical protein
LLLQGKIFEAKALHEQAFAMRKQMLGSEHCSIGDSQFLIAMVNKKLGKLHQSAALFERCLQTVRDARGARHPVVATVLYQLGDVFNQMGKLINAKDNFLESLDIRVSVYKEVNENHPEVIESYFGLAENLRYCGFYDYIEPPTNNDNKKNGEIETKENGLEEINNASILENDSFINTENYTVEKNDAYTSDALNSTTANNNNSNNNNKISSNKTSLLTSQSLNKLPKINNQTKVVDEKQKNNTVNKNKTSKNSDFNYTLKDSQTLQTFSLISTIKENELSPGTNFICI